ncbi:MAG: NUDIX hydrolase [Gemmatimonadetes bacterium]|nr:NUDIX hydrolase [Gemmatimonadota bacterium]
MSMERPAEAVGLIESRLIHDGRIKVSVDRVRFPDGSEGELEMIRHPGASAVLPVWGSLDERDPEVVLIRQYRYATDGYIYEVPAGTPEYVGEPWETCAHRELEEETGLQAGKMLRLTEIYTTPGFTDEVIHLFVATELSEGSANLDADEFLEVCRFRLSEVLEMLRTGEISDCKSVATIMCAAQFVIGRDPAA